MPVSRRYSGFENGEQKVKTGWRCNPEARRRGRRSSSLASRIPAALSPQAVQAPRLLPIGNEAVNTLLGGGLPIGGTLRSPSAQAHIEFRPSGRFAFKIREYLYARQEPTFFDRPERPLEGQLSVILHGLRTAALDLREKAERQAKEREAEEKLADQHRLAEVQFRKLDETLENWTKAEMLHRLIAHIERKMESETPANPSYAYRWLHWARTVATSLDPTSGSLDDFFQHYRELGPLKSPGDLE